MNKNKVVCPTCGKLIEGDFHYCPNCGGKLPQINDPEKQAIDSAINELFVDEEKKSDDLNILPLKKEQKIQPVISEKPRSVPPIKKDKSNIFAYVLLGLSVAVVALMLYFGYKIFFSDSDQPVDPVIPPVVNPENPTDNPIDKPTDKPEEKDPAVDEPTEPEETDKTIELAFTISEGDVLANVSKIEFEQKDNEAYRFSFYYEATDDLTITFGDSLNSFEPIGIDVRSGNSYVYFDLGKSLIKKDNAMTLTLYKQGTSENGKKITIEAETINSLLDSLV